MASIDIASPTAPAEATFDPHRLRADIDTALDRFSQFANDSSSGSSSSGGSSSGSSSSDSAQGCPSHLVEAIRYALLAPGKRLRPQLVLLAAESCGGTLSRAMPAAVAVEMVHAYSLVHDDLPAMDDDDLRRGRPTCHKVYGEDVAILVGDALLTRAFEILATEIESPQAAAQCCAVLGRAAGATALVGGQAADLAGGLETGSLVTAGQPDPSSPSHADAVRCLESIHSRKTGALFVAALQLGGVVASATEQQLAALTSYGRHLGLAFQIVDDLLDVAGDPAAVGKRLGKDADHGKVTFPLLLGIEESRQRATLAVEKACEAAQQLGKGAAPLLGLAHFVLHRNR